MLYRSYYGALEFYIGWPNETVNLLIFAAFLFFLSMGNP